MGSNRESDDCCVAEEDYSDMNNHVVLNQYVDNNLEMNGPMHNNFVIEKAASAYQSKRTSGKSSIKQNSSKPN